MARCHQGSLAVTAPQYTDTCPALHDLEAIFRRVEQSSIDQDRPALPRSMRFPALSDTNVDSAITHPYPVIWVGSEVLYTVTIRRRRRHFDEFLDRDYLDIPFNLGEVKISVVAQEPDVVRVVVEELLNDIIRPPQRGDQGVLTEAFEAHAVLPARHRHVPEVSKFHVAHRRPKGLPRRAAAARRDSRAAHLLADPTLDLANDQDRSEQVRRWLIQVALDAGLTGMEKVLQRQAAPHNQ